MFAAFAAQNLGALAETVHPNARWISYGANIQMIGTVGRLTFFEYLCALTAR
jgi:hypothetical protein